jgi:hypothetical protein
MNNIKLLDCTLRDGGHLRSRLTAEPTSFLISNRLGLRATRVVKTGVAGPSFKQRPLKSRLTRCACCSQQEVAGEH